MEERFVQYGAIGLLLFIFVSLFIWLLKTLFTKFLEHLDFLNTTQKEIANTLTSLKNAMESGHREIMQRLHEKG